MSAKETGYKWSKFVWDDWRNDASLQSCDLATKGIWMDLLSLMFSSERQGYLQANNKPMSLLYLSKKIGVDKRTIEKKLKVLIENNVCSVDENGIVFSRRMARETCKSPVSVQDTSSKNTVSVQEDSRNVPVNLQEKNAENSQKQAPLIIEQNRIDIDKKEPPCIPPGENIIILNQKNNFISKFLPMLVEHTKKSKDRCRHFIDEWLKSVDDNYEVVSNAIEVGILKDEPISYIGKILQNYNAELQRKLENEKYTNDPAFQKLRIEDQEIVLILLKNKTPSWLIRHYENHNYSAWKYWNNLNNQQRATA